MQILGFTGPMVGDVILQGGVQDGPIGSGTSQEMGGTVF